MESRSVHVVFLHDDPVMLMRMGQLFQKEPFLCAFTKDPDEAAVLIAKEPVKVVLSRQSMRAMSGIEFLKKIKVDHPDIVQILLTDDTDTQVTKEAINVGQVVRLSNKPFEQAVLRLTIYQAIQWYDGVTVRRGLEALLDRKDEELRAFNMKVQSFYEKQREFTSTVSHELRTPLAAIKMALDIIVSGTTGPLTDEQRTFLTKAKTNVDRLHRLINNILDLSKMEAGKIALKIKFADIVAVIEEVVDGQGLLAKDKGLSLKVVRQGVVPWVPFDRDRIIQVLMNLLSNAIKFTDAGEVTVFISVPEGAGVVEVCVMDTGVGIKADDIGRLFEKFEQLEGDVNHKAGGTGLGLAICKAIIEHHGGKIWARSEFGKGTAVSFAIPLEEKGVGTRDEK